MGKFASPDELNIFQNLFSAWIKGSHDPALLELIEPAGSLSKEQAMEVYFNAYRYRLAEALSETFEAVWSVLGDQRFFNVCFSFIETHPSHSYSLSDFGNTFPIHLQKHAYGQDFPFLACLADFEWRFKELFHAPEHSHIPQAQFLEMPADLKVTFQLGEAFDIFAYPYTILDIWKNRKNTTPDGNQVKWSQPQRFVIYKLNDEIFTHILSEAQYHLMSQLNDGMRLDRALEHCSQQYPNWTQVRVQNTFQWLVKSGIITCWQMAE